MLVGAVLACALVLTLFTTWFLRRIRVVERLNAIESNLGPRLRTRLIGATVSVQLTAALVLLVGCGILIRGFVAAVTTDLGYLPSSVVAAHIRLPPSRYPKMADQRVALDDLMQRLSMINGVTSVGFGSTLPSAGKGQTTVMFPPDQEFSPTVYFSQVTPSFFRTLGLRLIAGEEMPENPSGSVLVVNQSFADLYLKGDPLGREVELFPKTYRVVGVVSNALQEGFMDKPTPSVYFHCLQPPMSSFLFDLNSMHLIARVEKRPADQVIKIKSAVEAMDPGIRIEWIRPMSDMLAESVARPRFWTILATCLGLFAIAFSTVALYAIMSYSVTQRVPELSVRLALGATPAQIRQLVMKGAIGIVGKGLLAGTVLSLLVSQLFVDLVFGAQPLQLGVWASCAAALGACALVAAYLPARRGSQAEPAACLRAR